MKIAIFDHLVNESNAIGKCHLALLTYLADEHEFTVFALEFDNPRPDRIRFVKVPALRRPLIGLMLSFHIIAPLILWWYRFVKGEKFDLVQGIGGNFLAADLAYGHFCHRVYLREHVDARPKTFVKRAYSWLYDSIVSALEPINYARAKYIVTPSHGLARELKRHFKGAEAEKIHVIGNPVKIAYMTKPEGFNQIPMQEELGISTDEFVMVFIGAGHFERKGLLILLEAMAIVNNLKLKLIVVGGREYLINEYKARAARLGLETQVIFVGYHADIRPFLWIADVFAFPSAYETFSLVTLESAAAGLPLLTSPLNGVEEFIINAHNGWIIDRNPEAYARHIEYAFNHRDELHHLGKNAAESVQHYTADAFGERWRALYAKIERELIAQQTQENRPTPQQTSLKDGPSYD